jgi:hypothetical protein
MSVQQHLGRNCPRLVWPRENPIANAALAFPFALGVLHRLRIREQVAEIATQYHFVP